MDPHDQNSRSLTDSWRAGCRDNWHVRFGGAALGNGPTRVGTAPSVDPNHTTGCELIQIESGVLEWSTPAGMQYVVTPDRPLIDEKDLAELCREGQPTGLSDEDLLANQVPDPHYLPADLALDAS